MTAKESKVPLATGLTYNVLEWGKDDPALDHTVVLVHGFLDFAWGWMPLVDAGLADSFHVVAPDMRGHGDSDRIGPGGYYHFIDYVADLASLVEKKGRERVSLVGHSMGGTVCSLFAGACPDRVHRLALLEGLGPPEGGPPLPERCAQWLTAWPKALERENSTYPSIDAAAEQMCRYDKRLPPALSRVLAARGTQSVSGGGVRFKHDPLHRTRGPHAFSLQVAEQFWKKITCPVLLVDADNTEMALSTDDMARRRACIPHAHTSLLKNAGHMMQRHQPKLLADDLVQFLGG